MIVRQVPWVQGAVGGVWNFLASPRLPLMFAVVAALLFVLGSVIRYGAIASEGYKFSGGESHFVSSLLVGLTWRDCGLYSYLGGRTSPKDLTEVGNNTPFDQAIAIDCAKLRPGFAPENGHAVLITGVLSLGATTPYSMAIVLAAVKYGCILLTGILGIVFLGRWIAAISGVIISFWAFNQEAPFIRIHHLLDQHNLDPYIWVLVILFYVYVMKITYDKRKISPIILLLWMVGASLGAFMAIYRSSDFYMLAAGLAAAVALASMRRFPDRATGAAMVLMLAALVVAPYIMSRLHAELLRHEVCAGVQGPCHPVHLVHPVMHPIVLGLAAPPTPISERFGFAWLSDSETLKPAQFIDPEVKTLYSPEHASALLKFYIYIWKEMTFDTIKSYWIKTKAVYDIGVPAVLLGIFIAGFGVYFINKEIIMLSLVYMAKTAESILVYPMYTAYYHQSAGVLTILMVAAVLSGILAKLHRSPETAMDGLKA